MTNDERERSCGRCGALLPEGSDEGICPGCGLAYGRETVAMTIDRGALESAASMRRSSPESTAPLATRRAPPDTPLGLPALDGQAEQTRADGAMLSDSELASSRSKSPVTDGPESIPIGDRRLFYYLVLPLAILAFLSMAVLIVVALTR